MTGTKGRSGRRKTVVLERSNVPVELSYPRTMDAATQEFARWIEDNLPMGAAMPVDGLVVQTLAELMASQEAITIGLQDDPSDLKLHRLRVQIADKIKSYSAILGMTATDRARLPVVEVEKEEDPFETMYQRMTN